MSTVYTGTKVHNEIIFCTVYDFELKAKIEKEFLNNRISYYESWEKIGFIMRLFGKKQGCNICINEMQKEKAKEILDKIETKESIKIIDKPIEKTFF